MVGGPGCSCGVSVLLELTEFFCGDVHAEVVLFGVGYGQQWVLGVGMVWVVGGRRFHQPTLQKSQAAPGLSKQEFHLSFDR